MESQITYRRTMNIEYNTNDIPVVGGHLAETLQNCGLTMTDAWIDDRTEYGFKAVKRTTELYQILTARNKVAMSSKYRLQRDEVYNQLKHHWKVTKDDKTIITNDEAWIKPVGDRLVLDKTPEGVTAHYGRWAYNYTFDGEDVTCKVELQQNSWSNKMTLKFEVDWTVDKVQTGSVIENKVVDVPLETMALIQAHFEGGLLLAGYITAENVKSPTIDCTFEAITNSKSECSPQTIGKLREMKNTKTAELEEEE